MKKFIVYIKAKTAVTSSIEVEANSREAAMGLVEQMSLKKQDVKWKLGDLDGPIGPIEIIDAEVV